jgi:uncharacterized membrane protein (DUF2068 family)
VHQPAPGTVVHPQRLRPKLHWELLVCGATGHELVGTDARRLEPGDSLVARELGGARFYRCLRCDSWLPLAAPANPTRETLPTRDEIELPLRGRPLRDRVVLRLIAVNRAVHFLILGALAILAFVFASHRSELQGPVSRAIADLQGGVLAGDNHSKHGLLHQIDKLFSLDSSTIRLFGVAVAVYALVEGVEAVGLWYAKRWAEYLTLIVTASLLPVEVYELIHHATPFKGVALVVNLAIVVYLLLAKRLFGLRGGVAAEHALRERDVGWGALEASSPRGAV